MPLPCSLIEKTWGFSYQAVRKACWHTIRNGLMLASVLACTLGTVHRHAQRERVPKLWCLYVHS